MNKNSKLFVLLTKIDTCNGIWMMHGFRRHWHTLNDKNQLTNPTGEVYTAIATIDDAKDLPVHVTAPLALDMDFRSAMSHLAWMLPNQCAAQAELWQYVAKIEDPLLKGFAMGVLCDEKIMQPFYQGRASRDYHHNQRGELFVHSVEVARAASRMAVQYGLPKRTQDCAFVCGLLHDMGKTLMFYNRSRNREQGIGGQHEALSFMVLADHLEVLKDNDKNLFEVVSATLAPENRRKMRHDFIEEALVRTADKLSAHNYELGVAFNGKPEEQLHAKLRYGRKLKRLAEKALPA